MRIGLLGFALSAVVAAACGSESSPTGGEALYLEPVPGGNTFACATCHALEEPTADGYTRPGHPIGDAARRATFKNGQLTELLDAVNTCRREWMAASVWSADDADWLALREFLEARAPEGEAPALEFDRVDPPQDLSGGDPEDGRAIFNRTCIVCHGEDGAGTERAPRVAGLALTREYVGQRVRTSGSVDSDVYDGLTGGRMPFWAADRMSDAELRDVAAYVETSDAPDDPPDAGPGDPDAGGRQCGDTHAKVGHVAELQTLFHGVSGTATIADDCTIVIEMFNFDGQGIDVQIYGGLDRDYQNGFSMSGDLRRTGGYVNDTLAVQLPIGRSLDDLDGISVWCVPAGANFGDGLFSAP